MPTRKPADVKVDSAPVTTPEEGPEQRWRRPVRKRPAKLKLGRLLRDFGYAELDPDVAEAIEARMASVGLAIRPSLQLAAADEIVTVYRAKGASDDDAGPPAGPAPDAPTTPKPPAKPRRTADPAAAKTISELKRQLADAHAESERLRTELAGRDEAMAGAGRTARGRIAEQSAVVEDQSRQLTELSGLLDAARAALAEARDEIRHALGELPAELVEAPFDDAGLVSDAGWLTDADEPLPSSHVAADGSGIADEPGPVAPDDEAPPLSSEARTPAAEDLIDEVADGSPADASPAWGSEAPQEADRDAPTADRREDDATLAFEPHALEPPEDPLPADVASPGGDALGAESEDPLQDAVFTFDTDAPADVQPSVHEPDEARGSGVFTVEPPAASPPQDAANNDVTPPSSGVDEPADRDLERPPQDASSLVRDELELPVQPPDEPDTAADAGEWRIAEDEPVGDDEPPAWPSADTEPTDEFERDDNPEIGAAGLFAPSASGSPDDLLDDPEQTPAEDPVGFFDASDETPHDDAPMAPDPPARDGPGPDALPAPPPLPPSPFAEPPAAPPPPEAPRKRGRMARGRGRWHGTCSVCERLPEVTRRRELEAAGWQLDGDFPTCPQCGGL